MKSIGIFFCFVVFKNENQKNEYSFRQFGLSLTNNDYSIRNSQIVDNFFSTKKLNRKAEMKKEMEKFLKEKFTNVNYDYLINTKENESDDFEGFMKNFKENKIVKISKSAKGKETI